MNQVVIVAGGKGTRMSGLFPNTPKSLLKVGRETVIEHQLDQCSGFDSILVLTGDGHDEIERVVGNRAVCIREPKPLGTAGSVINAWKHLAQDFIVVYGDVLHTVDLKALLVTHRCVGADVSMIVQESDHPQDADLVEVNVKERVIAFHNRPHNPDKKYDNLANAAIYAITKKCLKPWIENDAELDFCHTLFPELLQTGAVIEAYYAVEYIQEVGTPELYRKACAGPFSER